jgi:peroxiredoxin Q/BCP
MALRVGETIPDVAAVGSGGTPVPLRSFLGTPLVVYFYPKDETPGCTAEACAFRDAYEAFVEAGATVVGISGDSPTSHEAFARRHGLPFLLLSDPDGSVRRAFGVGRTLGILPGRVTFVADARGVVRHVFSSQIAATRHVREALAVVERLRAERR